MPSKNGAAVIVAFGRKGTQRPARMLARRGYGVLIFDRRGEGESDGDPNPYAWDEGELDLLAAIDFLKQRPDVEPGRIGGVGLSVGGETFLQAASHSDDLKAVVSEGASTRSVGELRSVPGSEWGPSRSTRSSPPERPCSRTPPRPPPWSTSWTRRAEIQPRLLPGGGRAQVHLGSPRGGTCRGPGGPPP